MNLILNDEQKKLFRRTAALAKSYKPNEPILNMVYKVEEGGYIDESWNGPECNIVYDGSNERDINYEPFYYFILELIKDQEKTFLELFDENSWGEIQCNFNFETKTLSFVYYMSYYDSSLSEHEGYADNVIAKKLILEKNNTTECPGEIVRMNFDGGGDSGYIENIAENETGDVVTPTEGMESFGYSLLEDHYLGWENNEGGSGSIILDFSKKGKVGYTLEMYMNEESQSSGNYDFEIKLNY